MSETNDQPLPAAAGSLPPCEYQKCDGGLVVCPPLRKRLADGHSKGLNSLLVMNWKTGEEGTPIIAYKSSAHDDGIVLNFCPFCGSELNREYRGADAQGTRPRPAAGKE